MSISSQSARSQFTLSTKPQTLTIPWYFLASVDLKVVRTDQILEEDTDAVLNTHYTVAGAGSESGGTVTILNHAFWTVGDTVTVHRNAQVVQPTEYPLNGQFPSASAETQADRLTMLVQQLALEVKRSIRFPISQIERGLIVGAPIYRNNKFLGFDGAGEPALIDGNGAPGPGVPAGGAKYAVLKKTAATDFATDWFPAQVVNVKDYGAIGDGNNDDTTPILNAIGALTSGKVLYFPAGIYLTATMQFANLTGLTIKGDGWGVTKIKHTGTSDAGDGFGVTPGGQVLNIASTCSHVLVDGITFDGSCTHRKAGQQAVVIDADYTTFSNCRTINSGEYANTFGRNRTALSPMLGLIVEGNRIGNNRSDGINLYRCKNAVVEGNVVDGADDDLIAIGECENVQVNGNVLRARTDLATTWGRGIAILAGCENISVVGNLVERVKQTGLYIASEGGTKPNNITCVGNVVKNAAINSGNAVAVLQAAHVRLIDTVVSECNGVCIFAAEWDQLLIQGGSLEQTRAQFCRGIATDGSSGWAATWKNLVIQGVNFNLQSASNNECIYLKPHSSITMDTVVIANCVSRQAVVANYIDVDTARVGTKLKIVNNTSIEGNATSPSATAGVTVFVNNN